MLFTTLILAASSSFAQLPTPAAMAPAAMNPVIQEMVMDGVFQGGATHQGYLESFFTNLDGTFLVVNGRVYRLPPGTAVPPAGKKLTLRGVTKSTSGTAHYDATSVSW